MCNGVWGNITTCYRAMVKCLMVQFIAMSFTLCRVLCYLGFRIMKKMTSKWNVAETNVK